MANKERNKRSARQARAQKRAAQAGQQGGAAASAPAKAVSAKAAGPRKVVAKGSKPGLLGRMGGYLRAVRTEMRRVVWPSRAELSNYSVAVIVMLIVFGVAVWLVDTGFVALLVGFTSLRG